VGSELRLTDVPRGLMGQAQIRARFALSPQDGAMTDPSEALFDVTSRRVEDILFEGGYFRILDLLDIEALRAVGCSDSVAATPERVNQVNRVLSRVLRHVSEAPTQEDAHVGAPNAVTRCIVAS
jgi:hypothetical protein